MIYAINTFFNRRKDFGAFFIRLAIGTRLLYGVMDNILSWERMIEFSEFLAFHQFPFPLLAAATSVYIQFICGLLIMCGAFARMAAVVLILNFLVAIFGVHLHDTYLNTFPAIMILSASFFLLFNGAGKLSVDSYLEKRRPFY